MSPHLTGRLLLLSAIVWVLACDTGTEPETGPSENSIGPDGGTVTAQNLTLEIPPGALAEPVVITVEALSDTSGAVPEGFLTVAGTGFDLGPDGLTFQEPATLTIDYSDAEVPTGVAETELRMLRLDGVGEVLGSTVDRMSGAVVATVEHFSGFAVGLETSLDRVACPDLIPEATTALPLDLVDLGRVPDELEPPLAARATAGDSLVTYGAIRLDDEGNAELAVPIHPSTAPEGGPVQLNVTDGTQGCAAIEFEIEPLAPAPGELGAITDQLQAVVREQAAVLEWTPDQLVSTPVDELPAPVIPLALVQSIIDHPDNERSLRAMAEGTWPEAEDARLDLVEPLLARTGLRDALESAAILTSAMGDPAADISAGECTPAAIGENAALLDQCMDAAASAEFELANASGQVLNDLTDVVTYLGLVPQLEAATAVGGAATWTVLNSKKETAARLPSRLTNMRVVVDKTEFLEDEEATGSWSSAEVTATNKVWDLGKEALEAALQAANVAGIVDKFELAGPEVNDVLGAVLSGPVANALLEDGTIEEFEIPPSTFGPVNVTPEPWSESEVVGSAVARVTRREYAPREAGTATLSVRTATGAFAGDQLGVQQEITVKQIQVNISPSSVVLEPSEQATFDVTVENSAFPEKVTADADLGETSSTYLGGNEHEIQYTAPGDDEFTDLITVESTSNTGARAFSSERRLDIAEAVSQPKILVNPFAACVNPDGSQQFTAVVTGAEDAEVTWEVIDGGGTIGLDGVYTAPGQPGTARVQATAVADTTAKGEGRVTIGGCNCWWSVQVAGTTYGRSNLANISGGYQYVGQRILNILASGTDATGVERVGGFQLEFASPAAFGVGSWDAAGGGSIAEGSEALSFETDTLPPRELPPLSVSLLEADSGRIVGGASGAVVAARETAEGSEEFVSRANIAFRFSADSTLTTTKADTVSAACIYPSFDR